MLDHILDHLAGVLVQKRVVFHDEETVMILFQYGHELEAGESPAHIQLGDIAVQLAEDAGVVAANEEHFVSLQVEVINSIYQQLRRGDQDVEGVREQRDGWMQFDFHTSVIGGYEHMRTSRAWCESE